MHRDEHVFQNGHLLEETNILERTRDTQPGDPVRRQPHDLPIITLMLAFIGLRHLAVREILDHAHAVDVDSAVGRFVNAGDHVERRRLACTVRSDQTDDFIFADLQIQIVHRDDPAELHRDVGEL